MNEVASVTITVSSCSAGGSSSLWMSTEMLRDVELGENEMIVCREGRLGRSEDLVHLGRCRRLSLTHDHHRTGAVAFRRRPARLDEANSRVRGAYLRHPYLDKTARRYHTKGQEFSTVRNGP